MSNLYMIRITKKMVTTKEEVWNGRESDELCGTMTEYVTKQKGFLLTLSELTVSFEKEEQIFSESYKAIQQAKSNVNLWGGCGIEVNYPSVSTKTITPENTKTTFVNSIVLEDDLDDVIEETFYIFVREGMSVNTTFSKQYPVLQAPLKENRSGISIRGYAANMISDEAEEDSEYYESLFKLVK